MNSQRQNLKKARYTFAIAEMHYRAADILLKQESRETDDSMPSLLPSGYSLFSLALELYLKCLHLENGKLPPKTHNIHKLFKDLNQKTKDIIKDGYEYLFENSEWGQALEFNYPEKDFSLTTVLDEAKNGFEAWRYFHETSFDNRREMIDFNLYEVATAVRALITSQYPNWKNIDNSEIIGEKETLPTH